MNIQKKLDDKASADEQDESLKNSSAAEIEISEETAAKAVSAKIALAVELLTQAEGMLTQARQLIQTAANAPSGKFSRTIESASVDSESSHVIEGVFDGQKMIGPDGKHYSVPANYASKSKLVEGDLLKLTITARGAFVYKQIGPIARRRLRGILVRNQTAGGEYSAKADGRSYRVLTASVTYFRGHENDEAVILVPESGESKWAAVENIVKLDSQRETDEAIDLDAFSNEIN